MKIDLYTFGAEMWPNISSIRIMGIGNIRQGFLESWRRTTVGWSKVVIFSAFGRCIFGFGTFRNKAKITHNTVIYSPFSDRKTDDLELPFCVFMYV